MKNLIINAFILLLLTTPAKAQEYFPLLEENPRWNVYVNQTDYSWEDPLYPDGESLRRYYLGGDTTVNGVVYHKLIENVGNTTEPSTYLKGIIREEDKKVYYAGDDYGGYNHGGEEFLLYDYTCDIGDTVYHDYTDERFHYTIIKAIDSVKIAGEYRKRYKVKMNSLQPFEGEEYWIEGIGNVKNGILGAITLITEPGYQINWELVCYQEDGRQVYLNPSYEECYPGEMMAPPSGPGSSAINTSNEGSAISIHPNPFEHKLHIKNLCKQNVTLKVIDILGRVVIQKELVYSDNIINISGHHGLLFITLMDEQGRLIKREKIRQK